MGYKHTAPALQAPGLTPVERAVLALCAEFANAEKADCMWHDQEVLADRLEVRRETVGRALAKAEKLGYITRTRRYRTTPDGARQRDRDTVQVHHGIIAAATDAKITALKEKWNAKRGGTTPPTLGSNSPSEGTPLQGLRDDRSHTYVTTDHTPCDERSQHNRELQPGIQQAINPPSSTSPGGADNSANYRGTPSASATPSTSTPNNGLIDRGDEEISMDEYTPIPPPHLLEAWATATDEDQEPPADGEQLDHIHHQNDEQTPQPPGRFGELHTPADHQDAPAPALDWAASDTTEAATTAPAAALDHSRTNGHPPRLTDMLGSFGGGDDW